MALTELKGAPKVVGAKQVKKAIAKGNARKVYIACDAEPHVTEPIKALCAEKNIEIEMVDSMEILGHTCGIEVGSAAVAIIDE
ncbi:ribosomal L7Ae/L30e/S12e/Gadd45 family protein [Thermosyntropha sp.]|uniref:L7Ae/L30e/S12e/Gadd45 family ribosomal protein n=1 Tax=Thermosyntropha sp. TaxID=2740820 RepID=UPI0025D1BD8D|nr:ribosomal L7Ae/L30e/S12e/Gadd45 family protein [Thermosyntropha sp.]MBO8158033.1 ribosomal L7Ae/L30e/S12e/Gadd45 family protein [Thermosyntropha sp.]